MMWLARRKRRGESVVVFDSFTRANSAVSLGTADSGQAWSALSGTWGITSNQGYCAVSGGTNENAAVVESGIANGVVRVTMATSASSRVVFRRTDVDNGFIADIFATSATLYRHEAGSYTELDTNLALTVNDGDIFEAVLRGPAISILQNGTEVLSATSTFNQTATKHGIGASGATLTARFDNFAISAG